MPKYFLNGFRLIATPALPDDTIIMTSVAKQNKEFTIEEDVKNKFTVVVKIKPKDSPLYGIKWEEETEPNILKH